ncbi:MAG: hypothetical protein LBD68_04235 [Zoogloeaceae bacterium]|jgi:hypothetical protein|nr:hypothetical protein [Zoogloeaceae bacterium]
MSRFLFLHPAVVIRGFLARLGAERGNSSSLRELMNELMNGQGTKAESVEA